MLEECGSDKWLHNTPEMLEECGNYLAVPSIYQCEWSAIQVKLAIQYWKYLAYINLDKDQFQYDKSEF